MKDNKVRVTIPIDTIDWSVNGYYTGLIYISFKSGQDPIVSCYPIGEDKAKKTRSGYIFYYSISGIINLLNTY